MDALIEIDAHAGFCFGVNLAIKKAEEQLSSNETLFSLGEIVHNEAEVRRLEQLGMKNVEDPDFTEIGSAPLLIRTHGVPPSVYKDLEQREIRIVDATCPVVLKLQKRIGESYARMESQNGQVVIFGKKKHAETVGLCGQTNFEALVIESVEELTKIDWSRPFELFSQTTMPLEQFQLLKDKIRNHPKYNGQPLNDTICRQVANRAPFIAQFVHDFDVVFFVSGKDSSNGKYLFSVCQANNPNSYFVSSPEEITLQQIGMAQRIGITGATSTPLWLMEQARESVKSLLKNR